MSLVIGVTTQFLGDDGIAGFYCEVFEPDRCRLPCSQRECFVTANQHASISAGEGLDVVGNLFCAGAERDQPIHKKESGGRWVFAYIATNYDPLEWAPANIHLNRENILPFNWRDLIKPGVADGFFAYPVNAY